MQNMTKNELLIRRAIKLILTASACWCVLMAPPAWTQDEKLTEYQVKTAYLYNFAKFVEWPAGTFSGPSAPVIFGILGDDPFGKSIDALMGKTLNGRNIQVRRYHSLSEIRTCHVLFISASEQWHLRSILKSLDRPGTLLVSDIDGFAGRGGMIGFIMTGKTIGFEVNVDAVARAGIPLHSRLLNMAVIVHDESRRDDE
jgi:hypothetical protein